MAKQKTIPVPVPDLIEIRSLLRENNAMLRSMQADREAEFMTRREVMAALSLGRAAYQRMVKDGIIPEFQPSGRGGKAYVRRCDLEQLKAEGIL